MTRNIELGEFLRSRRAAADPERLSISTAGKRRVRGLRREEVAQLAGVSFDYYARLEQGRQAAASESVLHALAGALDLDSTERLHLFNLAGRGRAADSPAAAFQATRPGLLRLMDTVGSSPAILHGRRIDVVAANVAARAVIADFYAMPARQRNVARWFFLDEDAKRFENWESLAGEMVGMLRLDAGRHPADPLLMQLVDELKEKSPLFCELWGAHRVAMRSRRHKVLHHPVAGRLEFEIEALSPPADPDLTLFFFMTEPGSASERAVERLVAGRRHGAEPGQANPVVP
jgi:transcriptional regulator with XRE-family HTH domain